MTDLSNPLHIIVSRPNNRADSLIAQLNALATQNIPLKISGCPLITIADYFDLDWQDVEPIKLCDFNGVIFISGNAVENAKTRLSDDNWHQLLKSPLYAVGQQTADILQSSFDQQTTNPTIKFPQQMNSEGLLAMPELLDLQDQLWLTVKGLGGRETLSEGLKKVGARVVELHVYQRKLPDLIAQKRIASYTQFAPIWIITSLQALNNLWRILEQETKNCRVIVSSNRIAKEANRNGFNVVAQSFDATDKQLLLCVQQFIQDFA